MVSHTPNRYLAGPLYGKDPWPLRFHSHDFGAWCFNTLACSLIYNRYQFGTRRVDRDGQAYDRPSGAPPSENWRDQWTGGHGIVPNAGRTFPSPVVIEWISLDGDKHEATIDLDALFAERLILHRVQRHEVREPWLEAASIEPVRPDILVEVNDRIVNVFMRALIATETEQVSGNRRGRLRDDLMLAWTRTY